MSHSTTYLKRLAARMAVLIAVWLLILAAAFVVPARMTTATPGTLGIPTTAKLQDPVGSYWTYLTTLLQGRWYHPDPRIQIGAEMLQMAQPTLILLLAALLFALTLGAGSAIFLRLARVKWTGPWEAGVFAGMVLPETVVTALLWLLAYWAMIEWNYLPFPRLWIVDITWRHYVLPAAALTVFPAAYLARTVTGTLDELQTRLFIQVARAKGLSEGQLFSGHTAKHIGYRICSVTPALAAWLISSLIVVEWIFMVPGLGRGVAWMLWYKAVDPYRLSSYITIFMLLIGLFHLSSALGARALDPRSDGDAG